MFFAFNYIIADEQGKCVVATALIKYVCTNMLTCSSKLVGTEENTKAQGWKEASSGCGEHKFREPKA